MRYTRWQGYTARYTCTIPLVPPSLNVYNHLHWSVRERYRKDFQDEAWAVLFKWLQDVLVREGVIPDDTADRCTSHSPAISVSDREGCFVVMEWEA